MASARKAKRKSWAFSAGSRGRNRVRAFEHAATGLTYLEWTEGGRVLRESLGRCDRDAAQLSALKKAEQLLRGERSVEVHLTLGTLFDSYLDQQTPRKKPGTQQHDRTTAAMFLSVFGREMQARNLDLPAWNRFIDGRKSGAIRPAGRPAVGVSGRMVAYDLKWLQSVLRWATLASDGDGGRLLAQNPLAGFKVPTSTPRRELLSERDYRAIQAKAAEVDGRFALALLISHETGHRLGSIRALKWSDLDLASGVISWRADGDKMGHAHRTRMTSALRDALLIEQETRTGNSDLLFHSKRHPTALVHRREWYKWWYAAEELAGVPHVDSRAWHANRRALATIGKQVVNPVDLAAMGGWQSTDTLMGVYIQPDAETQKRAMDDIQRLRAAAE